MQVGVWKRLLILQSMSTDSHKGELPLTIQSGVCRSVSSSAHPTTTYKGGKMDYEKRLRKLEEHLAEHPKDYQASIARVKTYSDAVEHQMYLRKIERLKRVAKFRRMENEQESE